MPLKIARHPTRWRPKFQSQSPDLTYWSQRASPKVWFSQIIIQIFFFFCQLPCFGIYRLKISVFFKAGKADTQLCWTLDHIWEWKAVWWPLVWEGFKNKSKEKYLSTLRAEISYKYSHKNIFREDIRGLCLQGTQRILYLFFCVTTCTRSVTFFILNLPELTSQICSRCSFLKIVDFNGAFKKLSLEICLNRIRRERLV